MAWRPLGGQRSFDEGFFVLPALLLGFGVEDFKLRVEGVGRAGFRNLKLSLVIILEASRRAGLGVQDLWFQKCSLVSFWAFFVVAQRQPTSNRHPTQSGLPKTLLRLLEVWTGALTANGWIYGESAILEAGVRASHDRSPLACFSLSSWSTPNRPKRDDGPPDYANALSSVPWRGLVCKRYIQSWLTKHRRMSEKSRNLKRVDFRSREAGYWTQGMSR